jgi:ornithine carbamoyltransferase
MKKDLLSVYDLDRDDIRVLFENASELKKMQRNGEAYTPLKGKALGMIFDKSSTRTRISFEVGMFQLGGIALFLSGRDTQLGRGESVYDTARIISRYLNGIMIRTYSQELVEEFARHATIPVINGLTDIEHPCQILSDLFTIMEHKGRYSDIKVAYIGDGNNIANSWINAAAKLPFQLTLACPQGYDPEPSLMERGIRESENGISLYRDPIEAIRDADVVYTDVWTSMGQESEQEERKKMFRNYQINTELLSYARQDVIVMHCLPAHRGEEITAEVMDGPRSVVIDQAENRLHVQKAIMKILM